MDDLTIPSRRLNWQAASRVLAAAVAKADEIGVPQCIAVMDPGGNLIAYGRSDGACGLAGGPALRKARVAAERGHNSGALPAEFELGVGLATDGWYTNLPGGLPVMLGGERVGGIGVSGGSGDDDLAVARAGLAAIGASES